MSCYFLLACSKDTSLIDDYKLYDLDGSNQAIIGNEGMVAVDDVTGYDIKGTKIVFETGVVGLNSIAIEGQGLIPCRYGFIDTENDVVVNAEPGSILQKNIYRILKFSSNATVWRSCVRPR